MIRKDPLPPALALIACAMGDNNPEANCRHRDTIEEALGGDAQELLSPFHDLWSAVIEAGDKVEPACIMAKFPKLQDLIRRVVHQWDEVCPWQWSEYLTQLREKRRSEEARLHQCKITDAIEAGLDPGPAFLKAAERMESLGLSAAPPRDRKVMLRGFFDDLQNRKRKDDAGELTGIATGISQLDWITDGLQPGEFSVVGARPNMGKTAVGISTLCHVSMENETPTLFITLEGSAYALMRRLAACYTGANASDLRRGNIGPWERELTRFMLRFQDSPITMLNHVENPEILGIDGIVTAGRIAVKRHGVRLIIVDYLQKVRPSGDHESHNLAIAEVSEKLARLGQSTGAHVMALAQLKREAEGSDRAPIMSDLAESGHIERDADLIMLFHREDRTMEEGKIIVAKQRDGELDMIPIHFDLKRQRIQSVQREKPD